ncbi:MAG: LPD38 domain-containing protein [Dehalococcoidia bacterium]
MTSGHDNDPFEATLRDVRAAAQGDPFEVALASVTADAARTTPSVLARDSIQPPIAGVRLAQDQLTRDLDAIRLHTAPSTPLEQATVAAARQRFGGPAPLAPPPAPPVVTPDMATRAALAGRTLARAPQEAAKGFLAGAVGMPAQSMAALTEVTFGDPTGREATTDVLRGLQVPEDAKPFLDPRWWAYQLGQAGGSAAALASTGTVMGAKGAQFAEALMEASSAFAQARNKGQSPEQAGAAAAITFAANLPLVGLVPGVRGLPGAFSEGLARGAVEEAGQEAAQQVVSNIATGDPVTEGVLESAVVGGVAGPLAGSLLHQRGSERPSAQALAPPATRPSPGVVAPRMPATIEGPGLPSASTLAPVAGTSSAPRTVERAGQFEARPTVPSRTVDPFETAVAEVQPAVPAPSPALDDPFEQAVLAVQHAERPSAANVDPFEQAVAEVQGTGSSGVDVLDTGEGQPRLPEAGTVRDQEVATPTFEVPFSLARDADTAPREQQPSVFEAQEDTPAVDARQRHSDASQGESTQTRMSVQPEDIGIRAGERWWTAYPVERQTDLEGPALEAHEQAARTVESDMDRLVGAYEERSPHVYNADTARELFDRYRDQPREMHRAHRTPAASVTNEAFRRGLRRPVATGKDPVVVFTSGGQGAGKSTAALVPDADVVFDSTLSQMAPSEARINEALDSGRDVQIVHVYRDPVDAMVNGVLPRATTEGRTVTLDTFIKAHLGARETVLALADRYAGNFETPVGVRVFENRGDGPLVERDLDWLAEQRYPDTDVLRAQLLAAVRREYDAGRIDADLYAATTGERAHTRRAQAKLGRHRGESAREPAPGAGRRESPSRRVAPPATKKPSAQSLPAQATPASAPYELTRPSASSLAPAADTTLTSEPEAVSALATLFDRLPVRTGRLGARALGIYKPGVEVIRLKRSGTLSVFAHELGHYVHDHYLGQNLLTAAAWELRDLGQHTSRRGYTHAEVLKEGVAEYFRLYLADRAAAERQAPVYTGLVEAALPGHLRQRFRDGRAIVQRYLAQDLAARGVARIDTTGTRLDNDPRTRLQRFKTAVVDDLARVEDMETALLAGRPVDIAASGLALARLARGAADKAGSFVEDGILLNYDAGERSRSLKEALALVRSRTAEFGAYLVARHAPERIAEGKDPGMSEAEARAVFAAYDTPTFSEAAAIIDDYQRALLNYASTVTGLLPTTVARRWKDRWEYYVPLQRVIEPQAHEEKGRSVIRGSVFRRAKGSGRDIINPLESIIKQTYTVVAAGEHRLALEALVKTATEARGGGRWIEEIPPTQVPTRVNLRALSEQAHDLDAFLDAFTNPTTDTMDTEATLWGVDYTPVPGQQMFRLNDREGRPHLYQVNDKALYEALTIHDARAVHTLVKLLGAPARLLRSGATLPLEFASRNIVRDTFTAAIFSRYGFKPGVDSLRGLFEYLGHGDAYVRFLQSGGGNSALVAQDRPKLQRHLEHLASDTLAAKAKDIVRHPIDTLRAIGEAFEMSTRLGEFMKAEAQERAELERQHPVPDAGVSETGWPADLARAQRAADRAAHGRALEAARRGALAGRDVTLDFSRGGRDVRALNQAYAFFNARVQGLDKVRRSFQTDPMGTTIRAMLYVTLPSLVLWALNHDDEEYRERPEWERQYFWHVRVPGVKTFALIPKPFEVAQIFGTTFEKALDYITATDKDAWKKLFQGFGGTDSTDDLVKRVAAAVTPTALLPMLEVAFNYDSFRDRAIVAPWDEHLEPELQVSRWTSSTAKVIGRALDLSPARVDHLIYGYGSTLARSATGAIDSTAESLGLKPAQRTVSERLPVVSAFTRPLAGTDAESIAVLYKRKDLLDGKARSVTRFAERKAIDQARAILRDYPTLEQDRQRPRTLPRTRLPTCATLSMPSTRTRRRPWPRSATRLTGCGNRWSTRHDARSGRLHSRHDFTPHRPHRWPLRVPPRPAWRRSP